jgi:RNA polymerase sigma factor (sigma-70 family)
MMYNPFREEFEEDARDKDYIARALTGNNVALESLILRHQAWIYNIALNMAGDIHTAQDITQEVLIKVITKLSTYKPEKAAFRTWLYRIVLNHVLTMRENPKERFFAEFIAHADSGDWIAKASDRRKSVRPEDAIIAEEIKISCVLCTLLCISRRERFVFVLGAVFHVPDRVGADICGMSADNFRKIVSRARRRICDFLSKNCSLINEQNPCKCGIQAAVLIEAGILDPDDMIGNQQSYGSIRDTVGKTISELEASYSEFNALFKNQPFLTGPDMVQWLRDVLNRSDIQTILTTQ